MKRPYLIAGVVVKNPKGEKVIVPNKMTDDNERPAPDNRIFQTNFEQQIIEKLGLEEDSIIYLEMTSNNSFRVYGLGFGF